MQLTFVYSNVYFRNLNRHKHVNRTWDEVKRIGHEFENKYKSEIEQIIKIIPEVVGKSWRRGTIEVYIVDWPGPSFSHPLTLKVRDDLLLMLVILTHELLHDFYFDDKDKNIEEIEELINKNVKKVFEKLNLDVSEQLKVLDSFHKKRFNKK